jgi:hypothetical protein
LLVSSSNPFWVLLFWTPSGGCMPHSFYTYFFLNIFPPFSFPFCLSFLLHFFLSKKEKTLFLFLFFIVVCLRFVWGKTGRLMLFLFFFYSCTDPRWIFLKNYFLSLSTFLFCLKLARLKWNFLFDVSDCTHAFIFYFFLIFVPTFSAQCVDVATNSGGLPESGRRCCQLHGCGERGGPCLRSRSSRPTFNNGRLRCRPCKVSCV